MLLLLPLQRLSEASVSFAAETGELVSYTPNTCPYNCPCTCPYTWGCILDQRLDLQPGPKASIRFWSLVLELGLGSDGMCGIGLWIEHAVGLGARQE